MAGGAGRSGGHGVQSGQALPGGAAAAGQRWGRFLDVLPQEKTADRCLFSFRAGICLAFHLPALCGML